MSKQELRDYFNWFSDVSQGRIQELANVVRATPGFEMWTPDETPGSLDILGTWLATQVQTRQRTLEERQDIANRSPFPIEISNEELTNRTFSLAADVGMYLGLVLVKDNPSLKWEQPFSSKKFVDYGQPVLTGTGRVPFNPVRMLVTLAYGLANKKQSGNGLRELYDIWSKMLGKR
jgi:hypothetical protein